MVKGRVDNDSQLMAYTAGVQWCHSQKQAMLEGDRAAVEKTVGDLGGES